MEGASSNPYQASFAAYSSGLSFGFMQNDVAHNMIAQQYFGQILAAAGITGTEYNSIMSAAKVSGQTQEYSETTYYNGVSYWNIVNTALKNNQGLVNEADNANAPASTAARSL